MRQKSTRRGLFFGGIALGILAVAIAAGVSVKAVGPVVFDPNLTVDTVVSGLSQPTSLAFIGHDDLLVLEKASGRVKRITGGVLQPTPVLDLAVNSGSERGLLGIAIHPDFPRRPWVYLYWTESTATDAGGQLTDTTDLSKTPLLGNHVDRFVWNGSTLSFDMNLIRLHAFQADAGQPLRGNHNGGIIRFERSHDDNGQHEGDENHRDDRGRDDERVRQAQEAAVEGGTLLVEAETRKRTVRRMFAGDSEADGEKRRIAGEFREGPFERRR